MPFKIVCYYNSEGNLTGVKLVAHNYPVASNDRERAILPGRYIIGGCIELGPAIEDTVFYNGHKYLLPVNSRGEFVEGWPILVYRPGSISSVVFLGIEDLETYFASGEYQLSREVFGPLWIYYPRALTAIGAATDKIRSALIEAIRKVFLPEDVSFT